MGRDTSEALFSKIKWSSLMRNVAPLTLLQQWLLDNYLATDVLSLPLIVSKLISDQPGL